VNNRGTPRTRLICQNAERAPIRDISPKISPYFGANFVNYILRLLPDSLLHWERKEWKDGEYVETDKDKSSTTLNRFGKRNHRNLKMKTYKEFYKNFIPIRGK